MAMRDCVAAGRAVSLELEEVSSHLSEVKEEGRSRNFRRQTWELRPLILETRALDRRDWREIQPRTTETIKEKPI